MEHNRRNGASTWLATLRVENREGRAGGGARRSGKHKVQCSRCAHDRRSDARRGARREAAAREQRRHDPAARCRWLETMRGKYTYPHHQPSYPELRRSSLALFAPVKLIQIDAGNPFMAMRRRGANEVEEPVQFPWYQGRGCEQCRLARRSVRTGPGQRGKTSRICPPARQGYRGDSLIGAGRPERSVTQ